jgi:hypothetical protein
MYGGWLELQVWLCMRKLSFFLEKRRSNQESWGIATISRPVAGVLVTESAVLGVYVKRLKREERSGELELSTGCHARAKSCDADVTTRC